MSFVIWGVILGVKKDADFENDIYKRTSQRLEIFLVGFDVNGVASQMIFILFAWSLVGYHSRVVTITSMPLRVAYLPNHHFFSCGDYVSRIFEGVCHQNIIVPVYWSIARPHQTLQRGPKGRAKSAAGLR